MPFKSSGSVGIGELRTYFGASGQTALSSLYRGGIIPNVSQNSAIPTSGAISLSNFYGGYKSVYAYSGNIYPYNVSSIYGYWTASGVIGGGTQGSISTVFGSNPYTDGNGSSITINSAVYGWQSGQFTLQLSNTTDNDLKLWRVHILGGASLVNTYLYRSAATSSGSGGGGKLWNWTIANPFIVGNATVIDIEFIQ